MMRVHTTAPALLLAAMMIPAATVAHAGRGGGAEAPRRSTPRFEDYRVPMTFKGKPAAPKLNTPDARTFRTMIRSGAKEGPNFAGHYTITAWGCGTGCISFAIVDAVSGRVYMPDFYMALGDLDQEDDLIQYHPDSKLLIATGAKNEKGYAKYFYLWEKEKLKLIRQERIGS